ncbi:MAG: UDP-glucose 4-epimerase GalE [Acidothermales bacterium]|nr:UDP-glucose 4-epimerase GalE [Acidothermales bacterium]
MKLLVTGGAGYIGSIVASHLLGVGHEVTVLDDLSTGHADAVPDGAQVAEVSLLDAARTAEVVGGGFDGVLHFAAKSLVGESTEHPGRYWRNNVVGSVNLLEAMRDAQVPRLVFSSTAAVYGEPETVPIPEDAPARPTNPYGASKLAIDLAIGGFCTAHGLAATSLRYFNVAGASGRLGERHTTETHLIPIVLEAAAGRRAGVQVYGTDYPTADGTAVRDYIHVDDLARAHVLALRAAETGRHAVYNLGNGRGYSVREVVDTAREVTGSEIRATDSGRRPGDPGTLVASSARARAELGWVPEKAGLDVMVRDAWGFQQASRPDLNP